jgi:hypothetical protein
MKTKVCPPISEITQAGPRWFAVYGAEDDSLSYELPIAMWALDREKRVFGLVASEDPANPLVPADFHAGFSGYTHQLEPARVAVLAREGE